MGLAAVVQLVHEEMLQGAQSTFPYWAAGAGPGDELGQLRRTEAAAQGDETLVTGDLGRTQRRQVGPVRILVGAGLVMQGIEIEAIHVEQMAEQGPE